MTETDPLVAQVRAGESPELRVLAAQGILPLAPEDLIPLQVELAKSDDPFLAETARKSLESLDVKVAISFLAGAASHEDLVWFALEHGSSRVVEAILRRRDLPLDLLRITAERVSPDLQEVLLLRQDAILEMPEILDALERNPRLSAFARRRVSEYRQHLLPRQKAQVATAMPSEAFFFDEDSFSPEEIEQIETALKLPAEGEVDRESGLSEHQIRSLAVPVRLKLSRGASRTLRAILVRDINPNVALTTLSQSAFTEDEVELLAANRAVVEEVLIAISRKREWVARYSIAHSLVRNPRLPAGIAVRLVSRLSVRDLRNLSRDKNISDAVRRTAQRLYKIKAV